MNSLSDPIPHNETERLRYLLDLGVDYAAPNRELRDLCRIAADIAGSEVALISLVGEEEQRFAASIGLDDVGLGGVTGTPRSIAFCAHAIMRSEQLVVEDATVDDRFAGNELVTGNPGIRAYAGTPLEPEEDLRIGTLCVIDRSARTYDARTLRHLRGIADAVTALLVAHRDRIRLAEALAQSDRLHREALEAGRVDGLTKLLNAAAFRKVCAAAIEDPAQDFALVVMDVDKFKLVNDTYGHCFGDRYLEALSKALQAAAPDGSHIGRLGGDEFGVTLHGVQANRSEVTALVEACRTQIEDRCARLDRPGLGQVSFGAAIRMDGMRSCEAIFQQADIALYVSKESGRNTSTVYDGSHGGRFDERTLRTEYLAALERGQLVPFYQPTWNLRSGAITGFEVLCRWDHPERGILPPYAFASMLTDPRTAPILTQGMIRQACRDHRELCGLGLDPGRLAFNVTQFDLEDAGFIEMLDDNLRQANMDWDRIVIEVTESVVLGQVDSGVHRALETIQTRGIEIALDDFGTGFGGLQHLASWPIDTIKIDKAFTAVISTDERTRAIVKSIVTLAGSLGIKVVAEGIETEEQASILRKLRCDMGQGYLRGRPMSRRDLEAFLGANVDDLPEVVTFLGRSGRAG